MQIILNQSPISTQTTLLSELLNELAPKSPFAIARNGNFIPKSDYAKTPMDDGDVIDIISPVTGG